jgi:hypothetical protein
MEENNIKEEINNVINSESGIEIYVCIKKKNDNKKKIEIRKLNVEDKLRDALQEKIGNKLRNEYCNKDTKYNSIENYNEIKDEYCIIDKSEFDGINIICELDKIEEFDKPDNEEFDKTDNEGLQGFIFKYGIKKEYIILYQQFYPVNSVKKNTNSAIGCLKKSKNKITFKLIEEDIIKITDKIDIIVLSQYIISNKLNILENIFGFEQYIENISNDTKTAINNIGIIEETDKINKYFNDSKNKKRLVKMRNSKVLKMKKEMILERIFEDDYYKQNIKMENGKIKITSEKDFNIFIKLLNDDILVSNITKTTYDTLIKKEEVI